MIKRWKVEITYYDDVGHYPVVYYVEELTELQELLEKGPDWQTLGKIIITYNL